MFNLAENCLEGEEEFSAAAGGLELNLLLLLLPPPLLLKLLGEGLLAEAVDEKPAGVGSAVLVVLVVPRLLDIVFSGIKLEPVAFSLGMPLAKRPPRPSGPPPPPPPPPPLFPPLLAPPPPPPAGAGAAEPRLGLLLTMGALRSLVVAFFSRAPPRMSASRADRLPEPPPIFEEEEDDLPPPPPPPNEGGGGGGGPPKEGGGGGGGGADMAPNDDQCVCLCLRRLDFRQS